MRVVVTEAAPLPQQTAFETQFVPYEKDSYARASAEARDRLARKQPASVTWLEAHEALTNQILNAQKPGG